jgi:diacylglycerol kinase (ATP)
MYGLGERMTRLYDGAKGPWTEGVALALVNPAAAAGRTGSLWGRLEPEVRTRFPGLAVRLTRGAGDAERIADEWGRANPEGVLLVAGGDGTLHEAVNGLIASTSRAALGVLPAGSGNDFARNLGIPLDPFDAARRLQPGSQRLIDLGELAYRASGEPRRRRFLNSVSLGLSVRANRFARTLGLIPPGRIRYALAGVAAAVAGKPARYRVSSPAGVLCDGPALNLIVANGACFGGGMPISPASAPADGRLELIILGAMGRLRALHALARLQRGTHLALPELQIIPVTELCIEGVSPLRVEADGEELDVEGDLNIRILPSRLNVLGSPLTANP